MLEFKLAYKNLVSAKLRTWLNVGVLSFIYVIIIWHQGMFNGMYQQSSRDVVKDEIGGGQYWYEKYDPYDPFTFEDSHAIIPPELKTLIDNKQATAVLIRQASIYPQGRLQSVLLRGIAPEQDILNIPTSKLVKKGVMLPVLIGKTMAKKNSFNIGDTITIRWRDVHGTFDAIEGEIVEIMNTRVPTIDAGQLWVPLDKLQTMVGMKNEATMIIVKEELKNQNDIPGWKFKDYNFLLKDLTDMVKSKRISSAIFYVVLLFLAILAIFDTQVLAIWRRRKEIGTLMALGMTRLKVILLFTIEGMLNGILGIIIAAIYGIPLLIYTAKKGIPMPGGVEDYGFAIATRIFPVYSVGLVGGTIFIVMLTITIVSYLPTKKISKLNPTDALKGKIQ